MGIEYRIRVNRTNSSLADKLRAQGGVVEQSSGVFWFRQMSPASSMPDAVVRIEPSGLYFCDNGGAGRAFLGVVMAIVVGDGGSATIEEL